VVEVLDDGRGLPADHEARLFEPFFTTASGSEGTGLGLAICHATMERFGGAITACPRLPGPGAVFKLRFAPARVEVQRLRERTTAAPRGSDGPLPSASGGDEG
jgi:signal transduction histidine kinase